MKKCPKGHENPDNANYCRICGYEFAPIAVGQGGNEAKLLQEIVTLKLECKMLNNDRYDLKERLVYECHENNRLNKKIKMLEEELHNASRGGGAVPPKPPAKNKYTPDVFPHISFVPRAMFKPNFLLLLWMMLLIVFVSGMALYCDNYADVEDELEETGAVFVLVVLLAVTILLAIKSFKSLIETAAFKHYADFVESKPMIGISRKYHRIGKKGKIGVFDSQKKMIRISSKFDSIEKFDNDHLLISLAGKVGLYSLIRKKMIVPVKYTKIEPIKNYMIEAIWSGGIDHYDIKGNLKE